MLALHLRPFCLFLSLGDILAHRVFHFGLARQLRLHLPGAVLRWMPPLLPRVYPRYSILPLLPVVESSSLPLFLSLHILLFHFSYPYIAIPVVCSLLETLYPSTHCVGLFQLLRSFTKARSTFLLWYSVSSLMTPVTTHNRRRHRKLWSLFPIKNNKKLCLIQHVNNVLNTYVSSCLSTL